MRFLLLTDVHANTFGLEAVLAAAKNAYDQLLCLGDVVGYGAHPNECCEMLRAHRAWCLKGNHDAAALSELDIQDFNPIAKEAMLWTRRQLSVENISWLESLRPSLDNEEFGFQAVHGSLRDPLEEYIFDTPTARASLNLMQRSLCFYGHTHIAESYERRRDTSQHPRVENTSFMRGGVLTREDGWIYLVNPGSCGQPRDGNPQARYALWETSARTINIHAIDYDWQTARQAIIDAGLPRELGDRLVQGE